MKMIFIVLWCLMVLALDVSAQSQSDELVRSQLRLALKGKKGLTVAVMDFVNADGQQSVLGRYFSEESIRYLVKKQGVRLVERALIYQLEKEWDLSGSGLIADDQVIALGQVLAADAVVMGTLTKDGRHIGVYMRVVDAKTGEILSTGRTVLGESKHIRMYNDILK